MKARNKKWYKTIVLTSIIVTTATPIYTCHTGYNSKYINNGNHIPIHITQSSNK